MNFDPLQESYMLSITEPALIPLRYFFNIVPCFILIILRNRIIEERITSERSD